MAFCQPKSFAGEVSTTAPEQIPLTLREKLLKTLICPCCHYIFRPPVATCVLGHANCYNCTSKNRRQCGICSAELASLRNYTIEDQLNLVDVECGISICTRRINAAKLYDHFSRCEFRPIHCKLPIMSTGATVSGARIDCAANCNFDDYVFHLTQVHGVTRYHLTDPGGFYDFIYSANGEDFFRCPDATSALNVPVPLLVGTQHFLLHSQLKQHEFAVWVSAMFSEDEAAKYTVTIHLVPQRQFNILNPELKFPKWEARVHNYHKCRTWSNELKDRMIMQPTLLRRFTEVDCGKWNWRIICNIAKRTLIKTEPFEITID